MKITDKIHPSWFPLMNTLYEDPLLHLNTNILPNISYCPERDFIFRALEMPMTSIKAVILGQDPYPTVGRATGYAFTVSSTSIKPKSLQIIENEVKRSDSAHIEGEPNIANWPNQGILLLNTALTVETGRPGSHLKYWRPFIEKLVSHIISFHPCIWMLWGSNAKSFIKLFPINHIKVNGYNRESIEQIPIDPYVNYVLTSDHPMVEEYGSGKFYGNDHFYFVNRIFSRQRKQNIIW